MISNERELDIDKKLQNYLKITGILNKVFRPQTEYDTITSLIGGRTICCEIHKLIISIWNKEELPDEWKESIIAPIYKKGDKTDCNNHRGILLLPTTYKVSSNILLSRLTP